MNMSEHASKQFDADLAALRSRLVEMGGVVEEQFRLAIEALCTGHQELAEQVIANDARVNEFEVNIDDDCAHIIAKRQPAASDLRMILGVSKMVTDLERTGDKARKIARLSMSIRASSVAEAPWFDDIRRLGDSARSLCRMAINAFVRLDVNEAITVLRQTKSVSQQTNAVINKLVHKLSENPGHVAILLDMIAVVKAIDRVADFASNLAEHLIYIVKGTDVRHATLDQIEKETLQR